MRCLHHTTHKQLCSRVASVLLLLGSFALSNAVQAGLLPKVTGVTYNGNSISWQPMDGATGYNIYNNSGYLATVTEGTQFVPDVAGLYTIAAFDGKGNFSPLQRFNPEDGSPATNFVDIDSIVDTQPETLQNVFGIVYSATAGEIFWEREISRTFSYSVSLNGQVVGSTAGNSFWFGSLPTDTKNVVTVTAVSASGATMGTAAYTFDTNGINFPKPAIATQVDIPDPEQPVDVGAPQDVSLVIYSQNNAELFWSRETLGVGISTEVYRDDVLLGITDGNSFYINDREPNRRSFYELVTVNTNGDRSESTFLNAPVFKDFSEKAIFDLISGVTTAAIASPHTEWYPLIESILNEDLPDDIVEISNESLGVDTDGRTVTNEIYECSLGTVSVEKRLGSISSDYHVIFEDCTTNRDYLHGEVFVTTNIDGTTTVFYDALEIFSSDIFFLDGEVKESKPTDSNSRTIEYTDFEIYQEGDFLSDDEDVLDGDTTVVLNQRVSYDASNVGATSSLVTNMIVIAPWTNDFKMEVTTIEEFVANDASGGNYTRGSLEVSSPNGDNLLLSADTGENATWYAEVTAEGSTDTFIGDWNEEIKLPCITFEAECE